LVKMDGGEFERMLSFGLASLSENENEINKLNVFPVPDGDTGKNMRMTYESGLNALKNDGADDIGKAASVFARGALMGARGNSGVILSQIFKGIAVGLEGCTNAGVEDFKRAFACGTEKSYKAVVKPVEGTLLTVFRESGERASEFEGDDLHKFFSVAAERCEVSLEETPDKLDVLKEAGVVDSGGAGLLCIFKGFLRYFGGEQLNTQSVPAKETAVNAAAAAVDEEEFGYCTEFLLKLSEEGSREFSVDKIVSRLESIGGVSIVALRDEDIVKVHVHVETPGDVLNIAQSYGEFITIKIENMTLQHEELISSEAAVQKRACCRVACVIVACDDGFKGLFYDMGADYVVCGGQSMNPSVQDFLKAFETVNADDIIVLPNNSNVVMTAEQARNMYKGSRVHVVKTGSLAQGYSAISLYNPDEPVADTLLSMEEASGSVISMEITRAIRDAHCNGVEVKNGDTIAICGGKIIAAQKDGQALFKSALSLCDLSEKCVITLFEGETSSHDKTEEMCAYIAKNYPALEISRVETKQQIYDYIIAIE